MPSNYFLPDAPTQSLWGFRLVIGDRVRGSGATIERYYPLASVWGGDPTRGPNTVLCEDELTNEQNVAALGKPHPSPNEYWSGSVPAGGVMSADWEPLEYGTVYSISVEPVHIDGTLYQAVTGTIRYTEFQCDQFELDICCDSGFAGDNCDGFSTANCPVNYMPGKLYDTDPKNACGWDTSFPAPPADGPIPTFRRVLTESSRSLAQASCNNPLSYSEITAAGAFDTLGRNARSYQFNGIDEGQCCQVAVVAFTDDCESYDITECCADIRYTDTPTASPTCECPDSAVVTCADSTPEDVVVDILCPEGFACDITYTAQTDVPTASPTAQTDVPTAFPTSSPTM